MLRFSLKALIKCQIVRAFFPLRLNRFASGVWGRNENRDQSSLRSTGCLGGTLHTVKLDPRSSILTQDAPALFQATAVNLTAERPGKVSLKSLLSLSRVQTNLAHASGDDGDGQIGILAPSAMPSIKPTEVGRATDRNPGRFDKRPLQPLVAALE